MRGDWKLETIKTNSVIYWLFYHLPVNTERDINIVLYLRVLRGFHTSQQSSTNAKSEYEKQCKLSNKKQE